jgi:hypothetical protein
MAHEPPGRSQSEYRNAKHGGCPMSRAASDPARAFALLSTAAQTLADSSDASVLYRMVEAALRELVGFRLFTLLRATPARDGLERMHSSDLQTYPPGGVKPVGDDRWLQQLLSDSRPALSPDAAAVALNFPDAQAIFGLGCASVLNIPVCFQGRILGSMNLLHEAHWFEDGDAAVCQAFSPLLGAAWAATVATSSSISPAQGQAGAHS